LNEGDKCLRVRNLLRQWKADIICLHESKLEFISSSVLRSLWGYQHMDWCYSPSREAFGGILVMWDKRVVEKIEECVGENIVACSFRRVEDGFSWAFAGVYGPNNDCDRRLLWEELAGLLSWWNLPCCIGGDFNIICFPSERLSEARFSPDVMEFSDCIFELGLMDLFPVGGLLRGLITGTLPLGQELIGFLFLRNGKSNFPLFFFRKGFIDCSQTTSPFSLIAVYSGRQKNLLSLRMCGLRRKALWTWLGGGNLITFKALLASFWLGS